MTVLIFDHTGNYDTFTVSSVDDVTASIFVDEPGGPVTATYRGGPPRHTGIATVTEAVIRTYFRKAETNQLVYSDGSSGPEVPVSRQRVVDLSFEYWGDPRSAAANVETYLGPDRAVADLRSAGRRSSDRQIPRIRSTRTARSPTTAAGTFRACQCFRVARTPPRSSN